MKQGISWNWPEEKRKVRQLIGVWQLARGEWEGRTANRSFCCRVSVDLKKQEEVLIGGEEEGQGACEVFLPEEMTGKFQQEKENHPNPRPRFLIISY
ncbi:hypothetical protein MRB53_033839 [Persea americana]|uniref:Uncharacterized protein n=1 Tax=Persea americana TaxID=3435 RepID=A0ACC2KVT6_PERAE|nr:hypothetical protein MRB53_033839 [Persea americana]